MLSGLHIVDRAEAEKAEREHKKRKHKEKKSKDRKPGSNANRSSRRRDDSSGSSGSELEPRPAKEHRTQEAPAPLQREAWMTTPMARSTPREPDALREAPEDAGAPEEAEARRAGEGLSRSSKTRSSQADPFAAPASSSGRPTTVGDGGASWRLKALQRSQQRAREQGGSVEQEMAERHGSLESFARERGSGAAHANAHLHAARDRRAGEEGREGAGRRGEEGEHRRGQRYEGRPRERATGKGDYLRDVGSGTVLMRRPSSSSLSWKRPAGAQEGERRELAKESKRDDHLFRAVGERGEDVGGRTERREGARRANSLDRRVESSDRRAGIPDRKSASPNRKSASPDQEETRPSTQPAPDSNEAFKPSTRLELGMALADSSPAAPPGTDEAQASNRSAAALLRARLGKKPLATPRSAIYASEPSHPRAAMPASPASPEALPLVDARGRAMPGAFGRAAPADAAPRARDTAALGALPPPSAPSVKVVQRFDARGERVRYLSTDQDASLEDLVRQARHGEEDVDGLLARGIAANSRLRAQDLQDADLEYDYDVGVEALEGSHARSRERSRRDKQRDRDGIAAGAGERERARQERRWLADVEQARRCERCADSPARPGHLLVAAGGAAYLSAPSRGRLGEGHCHIAPLEHIASLCEADEGVATEVRNFKKCLIRMQAARGHALVFVEVALGSGRHAFVDCVPIPFHLADKAALMFRKAVDDSSSEWDQHHAKRFIDASRKSLAQCIPRGFSYMHVEFGLSSGFVHVIDDERKFDRALARNVLIGLLQLPEEGMHQRGRKEAQGVQERWTAELREAYAPFDWTAALDQA